MNHNHETCTYYESIVVEILASKVMVMGITKRHRVSFVRHPVEQDTTNITYQGHQPVYDDAVTLLRCQHAAIVTVDGADGQTDRHHTDALHLPL